MLYSWKVKKGQYITVCVPAGFFVLWYKYRIQLSRSVAFMGHTRLDLTQIVVTILIKTHTQKSWVCILFYPH